MFEKLSKFFGAKNNINTTQAQHPENPLMKYETFGGMVMGVAKDRESLDKMTEGEISSMMYEWKNDLYDLERQYGYLSRLADNKDEFEILDGLTLDLSGISEIEGVNFKIKGLNESNELRLLIEKNETPEFENIKVFFKNKPVLTLELNYSYNELEPIVNIEHFLPGVWLDTFIEYLKKGFDNTIEVSKGIRSQKAKLKLINEYNTAVTELKDETLPPELKLEISKSTDGMDIEDAYQLAVLNMNQWKESLTQIINANRLSFSDFKTLCEGTNNEDMLTYITSKGFASIKFLVDGEGPSFQNPLGGDGTEIIIEENYSSDFSDYVSIFSDGKEVLKLRESYSDSKLEVLNFIPGKWLNTAGALVFGDLNKINERSRNLKNSGMPLSKREMAAEMFDL